MPPPTMAELREAAAVQAADDPAALTVLGLMHASGQGGAEPDLERAAALYAVAAARGDANAKYNLAVMWHHGQLRNRVNLRRAAQLYTSAAEAGVVPAMYNLGMLHLHGGDGLKADVRRGLAMLKKASARGHALAPYTLGTLYDPCSPDVSVPGITPDAVAAKDWYALALQRGTEPAAGQLAYLSLRGPPSVRDPSAGFRYAQLAAAAGDIEGKQLVAQCYLTGNGVPKDEARGLADFEALAAAPTNHFAAAMQLAIYARLYLTPPDATRALAWYTRAAEMANNDEKTADALEGMAWAVDNGGAPTGAATDNLARVLYTRAADAGNGESMLRLAHAYQRGELGCEVSPDTAFAYAVKAFKASHWPGLRLLADFYRRGFGTDADVDKALKIDRLADQWDSKQRAANQAVAQDDHSSDEITDAGEGADAEREDSDGAWEDVDSDGEGDAA